AALYGECRHEAVLVEYLPARRGTPAEGSARADHARDLRAERADATGRRIRLHRWATSAEYRHRVAGQERRGIDYGWSVRRRKRTPRRLLRHPRGRSGCRIGMGSEARTSLDAADRSAAVSRFHRLGI